MAEENITDSQKKSCSYVEPLDTWDVFEAFLTPQRNARIYYKMQELIEKHNKHDVVIKELFELLRKNGIT